MPLLCILRDAGDDPDGPQEPQILHGEVPPKQATDPICRVTLEVHVQSYIPSRHPE